MTASEQIITCDGCGRDITYTGNCVDYRLALVVQSLHPKASPGESVPVTAAMIYPPLDGSRHFCNLRCLQTWIAESNQKQD